MAPELSGPFGLMRWLVFNSLCVTAIGHPGLEPMWAAIKLEEAGDKKGWDEFTRRYTERTNRMMVVAGLLLASSAVFLSTLPPRPDIANYILRGPYICMLCAFGLLIGAIIYASVQDVIVSQVRPSWVNEVLLADRVRVYAVLIVASYPYIIGVGFSAMLLALGSIVTTQLSSLLPVTYG
ncbi:hypothetical protein V5O48_015776 [Marasmius crinis-equi]|uniref:Uncharacterized protein n=1 Tax=Marasmius crinis-equi TaxID=585013 RepID=A0ABR3ETK3_9AGAR